MQGEEMEKQKRDKSPNFFNDGDLGKVKKRGKGRYVCL